MIDELISDETREIYPDLKEQDDGKDHLHQKLLPRKQAFIVLLDGNEIVIDKADQAVSRQ